MKGSEDYREFYEYEAGVYAVNEAEDSSLRHRRTLERRLLPHRGIARACDVGCADGALSEDLLRCTGCRLHGVDLSLQRARTASRRLPEAAFVQGSAYELPWADGAFDLAVCTDVLEHLDDPRRAMRELVRVSSRHVLVTVPYSIRVEKTLCPHCRRTFFLYGHQHSFGKDGIRELAAQAGARVVAFRRLIPMFECRRYRWFPPLKWLLWSHFKDTGTLGALIEKAPLPATTPLRVHQLDRVPSLTPQVPQPAPETV